MSEHVRRRLRLPWLSVVALASAGSVFGQAAAPTVFVGHWLPTDPDDPDDRGTVVSVRVAGDGTLSIVDTVRIGRNSNSLAISPDGSRLAVGGGSTGMLDDELLIFAVNPDGSLDEVFSGNAPNSAFEMIWLTNDRIAITETSTSRSFLHTYQYYEDLQLLLRTDQEATGGFTTSLAYRQGDSFLYSQESTATNTIQRWALDLSTGRLDIAQEVFNFDLPLDLEMTPDGRFLFSGGGSGIFASGCNSCINGYDISDEEGMLPLPGNPYFTPNNSPARLGATENGYLAVGHGGDAVMRIFDILQNGDLVDTGIFFDLGSQGDLGRIEVIGNRLFVTDDSGGGSSTIDPIRGLYSFTVNDDGTLTQHGEVLDTGRTPDAMEVWPGTGEVLCVCERDGDASRVSVGDLLAYLELWLVDDLDADLDANGAISVADLLLFLDCWFEASGGAACS